MLMARVVCAILAALLLCGVRADPLVSDSFVDTVYSLADVGELDSGTLLHTTRMRREIPAQRFDVFVL